MTHADKRMVLEPAAQALADATAEPPYLFDLGPIEARRALADAQASGIAKANAEIEDMTIPGGPSGRVAIRVVRPAGATDSLPVILYIHGGGWVRGDAHTHDRLIRELAVGANAAVVFTNYTLSPEARYPTAAEEVYSALEWVSSRGSEHSLHGSRIAVAGDGVGGNMTAAVTLMATQRSGPRLAAQVLFYPVTDSTFDTASYHQFAEGYYLRRDAMQWSWDQYAADVSERAEITASPLRAPTEQLSELPQALVITAEADVVRDEGEAYAQKLCDAGVDVTATRYRGIVHDFVVLDALRGTNAAQAAISEAVAYLRDSLGRDGRHVPSEVQGADPAGDTGDPHGRDGLAEL